MNYQKIALNAANRLQLENIKPNEAWALELKSTSTTDKGCPKCTFLGLCQQGFVKNVPINNYTTSIKNLSYAIKGVELLRANPNRYKNGDELWHDIVITKNLGHIAHNQQGNVIFELWQSGLLI